MSERWCTPPEIFDPLHREFHFDLDAAADAATTRLPRFLSGDSLALEDWPGQSIFLNPPYGRKLEPFVRRAWSEAQKGKLVVAVIPFRCRGSWWHDCVIDRAVKVRCVRKRPKFIRPDGSRPKLTGSCDTCVVIWNGVGNGHTILESTEAVHE